MNAVVKGFVFRCIELDCYQRLRLSCPTDKLLFFNNLILKIYTVLYGFDTIRVRFYILLHLKLQLPQARM